MIKFRLNTFLVSFTRIPKNQLYLKKARLAIIMNTCEILLKNTFNASENTYDYGS